MARTRPTSSSSWTAISDGDVASIIAAEQAPLERYVRGLVRDPDQVADVVQEAFLRFLLVARARRAPENPGAWLRRVAHNSVVSEARHRVVVERHAGRGGQTAADLSTEDAAIRRERDRIIARSLHAARPDDRTVLVLAAQGFDGGEIAAALGRTAVASRALLFRARGRLRARLDAAEVM